MCATRGILELLEPAELEGVMAHELTHVINRDVMVMTLASFFATLASTIAQFALFFGGGYGNREEEEDIMIVVLVSVLVYAISFLLLRALSRYREFAADRGSAVLTGRPSALASALLKISGTMERVPSQDLRTAEGMSAFFIIPARTKKSLMNIFADHPPLEQRLAALERLESQLQGTTGPRASRRHAGGPARHPHGPPRRSQGPGARPPVRDLHRLHRAAGRTPDRSRRRRRDRLPGARHERVRSDARAKWKKSSRPPAAIPARRVSTQDDSYGYRWMVLRNPDGAPSVEDLAVGINAVSGSIETAGHGERLLCAVFAFADAQKRAVYFIYNYKRGFWYPFVPERRRAPTQRSTERELQLKAQMSSELPIEPELERWFPLWGSRSSRRESGPSRRRTRVCGLLRTSSVRRRQHQIGGLDLVVADSARPARAR